MRERVCKNCGGRLYKVVGQNMVKCMFCGTLYVDERASKEEEVLIVGAYEKLRDCDFDGAKEEFDKILSIYPKSFEGFYGKCLAKNKIIFYTNHKGGGKRPRFFGDEIPSILQDEDFLNAVKNAPPEVAKTYNDQAKRIEKIKNLYTEQASKLHFDVVAVALSFNKEKDTLISKAVESLRHQGLEVYFVQDLAHKEREEETFRALQTAKAFVLFANEKEGFGYGEIKNLFDRYLFFVSQKKKTKSSFVIACDSQKLKEEDFPKELLPCKSVVDMNAISFLQDIQVKVKKEVDNADIELAKIDTVNLDTIKPQKKEYVDVQTVTPTDLGHYQVENVPLSDENKIKWLFLTIKNGDFASAKELVDQGLEKDENNAELLFADLLIENNIRSQEEFFSSIGNFRDKEKIDKILKYASKEFAESFVDSWENLIIKLDSEEYYNAFLLYLASFNSPNRENFINHAEQRAVETLNEELIEKVIKCFKNDEVDRFVQFYFMLAQKSDDKKYYQKILELDAGHEQSNITLLLQHFKTDEDKLNFRDRETVEDVFKFLSPATRTQFVSAVVDMILPIAFFDIEKAEKQIDFYLSYVNDDESLCKLLVKIAEYFQNSGFFKQAEKYLAIAISKDKNNAEFYWMLVKIKAHCKNDNELIMSGIKVTQMPEWETMLSVADEKQTEKYAEIASKISLYSGEKVKIKADLLDKVHLIEKLQDVVARNNTVLLDIQKQEGDKVLRGVNYYKLQLQPFEKYAEEIKDVKEFSAYSDIISKINTRLDALNLTLETSINVVDLLGRDEGLKNVYETEKQSEARHKKRIKDIKNDKFLKKFLYGFLELFPILFTTLLLVITIALPKEVFLYFNQTFLIVLVILSTLVGMVNLVVFIKTRYRVSKGWNVANCALFCFTGLNLILTICGLYLFPTTMEISNVHELKVLLANAPSANFKLTENIDLDGATWSGGAFSGVLDGDGHTIENVTFRDGKNLGLFDRNNGQIKNLNLVLADMTYQNATNFGSFAISNHGLIENCSVSGNITLNFQTTAVVGGIAGAVQNGNIENCLVGLNITITIENGNLSVGEIAGRVSGGNDRVIVENNNATGNLLINANNAQNMNIGGLVGEVLHIDRNDLSFEQNESHADITLSGSAENAYVGGLVGYGRASSQNNLTTGTVDLSGFVGSGYAGGLYGSYQNTNYTDTVTTSYSLITFVTDEEKQTVNVGSLFGYLDGRAERCFTNSTLQISAQKTSYARDDSCINLAFGQFYDSRLNFDENIWQILDENYPKLR